MIFTWLKNGKPDVSMCLNASLAGLVGVTAGCSTVDAVGAAVIGIVSGLLVVFLVELLDLKLHIDDPVGAVAVHFGNGIWGTIAAGLLSTAKAPAGVDGPIYAVIHGGDIGAGFKVLGVQILGTVAILAWTTVCMLITFTVIKKTNGLRASREEEIVGLDPTEHGLPSAYADFVQAVHDYDDYTEGVTGVVPMEKAVEVNTTAAPTAAKAPSLAPDGSKITKLDIICRQSTFESLKHAMAEIGVSGMTVTQVLGCGTQGRKAKYRGVEIEMNLVPKVEVEIVVCKVPVSDVVAAAKKALYTGNMGDGKIFVYNVENAIKIRTGEEGYAALQDDNG